LVGSQDLASLVLTVVSELIRAIAKLSPPLRQVHRCHPQRPPRGV